MAVPAFHPSMFAMFGIITLLLWRVYSRIRRMVGRQTLSPRRLQITLVVFPLLLVLLMLTSLTYPLNAVYLCVGAAAGALLGVYGLGLTRFEVTEKGLFYTPSSHLGIALSLIFAGRVVYRLVSMQMTEASSISPPTGFASSPLTLLIFAVLAGYYVSYAIGLLRWSRSTGVSNMGENVDAQHAQLHAGTVDTRSVQEVILDQQPAAIESRSNKD